MCVCLSVSVFNKIIFTFLSSENIQVLEGIIAKSLHGEKIE